MRKNVIRIISLLIASCVSVGLIGITAWATGTAGSAAPEPKYEKPDTNQLTNLGQEPEEISVSSKEKYFGKAWYEYIAYSDRAVSSIRISNDERIIFYDPIDYSNSMVMDITYDDTIGWSTANSVTITHEFSTTLSHDTSYSTETSTDLEQAMGQDITGEISSSSSTSASQTTHQEYSTSAELSASKTIQNSKTESIEGTVEVSAMTTASTSVEATFEATVGTDIPIPPSTAEATTGGGTSVGTEISAGTSIGATTGTSTGVSTEDSSSVTTTASEAVSIENSINDETASSETKGWSLVADRITTSKGSSSSTTTGWSNTETLSIARTFEALYFTDNGTPYTWTIAYYEVKMPMKAALQYKIGGKWVTIDTGFVLLTTIQGSCRAWNVNGTIHYEHWGTSEPVVASDFWSGFFTEQGLMDAYNRDGLNDKLYPD